MGELKTNTSNDFPQNKSLQSVDIVNLDESRPDQFSEDQIGVTQNLQTVEALTCAKTNGLRHLVNSSKSDYERELSVAAGIIENNQNIFNYPAASVLAPDQLNADTEENLKFVEFEFSKAADKYSVLILMELELAKLTTNETLIGKVRTIADEFFTNAVYNAPNNLRKDPNLTRKELLQTAKMDEGKRGHLFLAYNDNCLLLGCKDPYGSLIIDDVIKRIVNCYENGIKASMNLSNVGGAGIGLYMSYDMATNFYLAINPGVETLVMCSLPMQTSNKDTLKLPKNYHFLKL